MSALSELREQISAETESYPDPCCERHMCRRFLTAIDAADAARSRPRIKVKSGATFIADLARGIASDTFTLGPIDVFRGKGAREAIAHAESADGYWSTAHSEASQEPGFLEDSIANLIAKASLVPVVSTKTTGAGFYMDVTGEGGVLLRVNARFWAAMDAVSDRVEVDTDWRRPAVFMKHDTVIGCVMPVRRIEAL